MKSINPLHYKYWIIILILLNIAIFSYYNSGDTNLTGMIAFAATIASIILSVLAIFMSILSNDSIGGMLHRDKRDFLLCYYQTPELPKLSGKKEADSCLPLLDSSSKVKFE